MERYISYCVTGDGVRIAYADQGKGPPLVRVLGWATHLEFEQTMPRWDHFPIWGGAFGHNHRFITYDGRGFGLSDRRVYDFSVDAKVRDLEAVADAAGLETFDLLAISEGGPTAVTYVARNPGRVRRLVFYGSFARPIFRDTPEGQQAADTLFSIVRQGWGSPLPAHRQFFTSLFMPDAPPDLIQWFNELQRVSSTPENVYGLLEAIVRMDVSDLLPSIKVPTLVIHRRQDACIPFSRGRHLASSIPGARFLSLDGRNHFILPSEPEIVVVRRAIDEFLGVDPVVFDEEPQQPAVRPPQTVLRTVLFADVVESTSLTARIGDEAFRSKTRQLEAALRNAVRSSGGRPVEGRLLGDGVMAVFASARDAVNCALALEALAGGVDLKLHVGLHAGDVIEEENDVFGGTVNIAARVASAAAPGEVLVSDVVRNLARTSTSVSFLDRGEQSLKGLDEALRLYELRSPA